MAFVAVVPAVVCHVCFVGELKLRLDEALILVTRARRSGI